MLTAETGFSAPTDPNIDPSTAFAPVNFAGMPHDQAEAYIGGAAEVAADIFHVAKAVDGRQGVRTAEGYVALFRVGQVVHLVAGNEGHQAVNSQYMGHDGVLRDYNPHAEFLPFEVRTFREGLAERLGQPVEPLDGRIVFAEGVAIGAEVIANEPANPHETRQAHPRFARLRRLGRFALDEARNAARSAAERLRTITMRPEHLEQPAAVAAPTARQPLGRHRFNAASATQVHASYVPSQTARRLHIGRHRRPE